MDGYYFIALVVIGLLLLFIAKSSKREAEVKRFENLLRENPLITQAQWQAEESSYQNKKLIWFLIAFIIGLALILIWHTR